MQIAIPNRASRLEKTDKAVENSLKVADATHELYTAAVEEVKALKLEQDSLEKRIDNLVDEVHVLKDQHADDMVALTDCRTKCSQYREDVLTMLTEHRWNSPRQKPPIDTAPYEPEYGGKQYPAAGI